MSVSTASAPWAWLSSCPGTDRSSSAISAPGSITLGLQVGCLFHYMAGCLCAEWDDPNNAMAREGGRLVQDPHITDSDDLLDELDHPFENPLKPHHLVQIFR